MLRARLTMHDLPILTFVSVYNAYMRFFVRGLGLNTSFGQRLIKEVANAATRIHKNLFGEGQGVVEEVRRLMVIRFAMRRPSAPLAAITSLGEIGRAVQQECRDRSRMPSSA
eukprot:TRINITY_DN67586_c0_g1_i2.p1 TRINITY_DN67586_c0_g1~~TRINITY_DN67586_c0_g1_i2.p1  ORF type:complete len:112 (-),score=18.87 TRINITY_DN67586_c0_g1_i2:11-346(-)